MANKVQETHLYKWLSEKNSEFLGQINKVIKYSEDTLPLINLNYSRLCHEND